MGERGQAACGTAVWQSVFRGIYPTDPAGSSLRWRQSMRRRLSGTRGQRLLLQINLPSKTPLRHSQNSFAGVLERNRCPERVRVSPRCGNARRVLRLCLRGSRGDAELVPCTSALSVPASCSCCPQNPGEEWRWLGSHYKVLSLEILLNLLQSTQHQGLKPGRC